MVAWQLDLDTIHDSWNRVFFFSIITSSALGDIDLNAIKVSLLAEKKPRLIAL